MHGEVREYCVIPWLSEMYTCTLATVFVGFLHIFPDEIQDFLYFFVR